MMAKNKINTGGIMFVVFLQQVVGFVWYSPFILGDEWIGILGKSIEELQQTGNAPYIASFAGSILYCYFLDRVIHLTNSHSILGGLKWGFLLWLCVILPVLVFHYLSSATAPQLIFIDGGKELINALLAGFILGGLEDF